MVVYWLSQIFQFSKGEWVIDGFLTPNKQFSAISWREQVKYDEMIMLSALYWTKTLSWNFIVLAHWNNTRR